MRNIMNLIKLSIVLLLVMSEIVLVINASARNFCANVKAPLIGLRKKRHLTFPPGTALVITMSLVKTLLVHAPSGWNIAIEIDVIHPMLTPEMTNQLFRKKIHHRQKRELWETIENALNRYNMNGRSCIYRSICEAKLLLAPPGKSIVHDILRSIFSVPVHEKEFQNEVKETYDDILEPNFCQISHDCPISILGTLLSLNKS